MNALELTAKRWPDLENHTPTAVARVFEELQQRAGTESAAVADEAGWRAFRDRWQGRRGGVLARVRENWLAAAPADAKPSIGQLFNLLSQAVARAVEESEARLAAQASANPQPPEAIDVTLPGRGQMSGTVHPTRQVMEQAVDILLRLGYSPADGPEIESEYYNFEALNIPADHPARDDQDTLYLSGLPGLVLRSHTSPVQIRVMQAQSPPLRMVTTGKVYRRDAPDASHSPVFHQLEGLAVDRGLTLRDLKGTLDHFARELFGAGTRTRFRPSFFGFTEPSAEMDVSCVLCQGAGCRACKQSGWIEILGGGMVHPTLFERVGYDPELWSGFAFGMGLDRITMLVHGIDDIQRLFSGDVRFLDQFAD